MADPLNSLLDELLRAHDRMLAAEQPSPARASSATGRTIRAGSPWQRIRSAFGTAWRGSRRRTIAVVSAGVIVVTGSATAAVLLITASRPLTGPLPPELLGTRYALRVAPDLQAGHIGWCVSLLDIEADRAIVPIPTDCVSGEGPLIVRGGFAVLSPKTGRESGRILYAIVDRRVAVLRAPDGVTIRPIASGALPPGWRAAVTVQAHPPAGGGHSPGAAVTLTPIDRHGTPLPAPAGTAVVLPTRTAKASSPPATGCRIRVHVWAGVRLGPASVVVAPTPRSPSVTTGYLACYSLSLDLGGGVSTAAVLVDAARPGAAVPAIPGFHPLRGAPGVWIGPEAAGGGRDAGMPERLYARRIAHAWLVLETPATQPLALYALRRISASG